MATFDDIEQKLKETQETSTKHTSSAENVIQQHDDESDILRAESLEKMKETISTQDLLTAVKTIENFLEQQDRVELNIAVTGESGSGKSKFVNAFRGLGDEDEGSASTGVVETTMEPKVYIHPKYKNVKVWDLPGIGTPNFKANEYLKQVQFERYDFFIIIASERFRECHTQLVKKIKDMKKKFYFVRSKIDLTILGEQDKSNFDLDETLKIICENCKKELQNISIEAPVFLISSRELGKYDFNLLLERMERDLSQHKKHMLMLAVPNITLKINDRKKKALEKNIFKMAFLSACVAAIPIPDLSFTVDLAIIKNEIEKYYSAFGLDDAFLHMLSERSGKTIEELKNVMKSSSYQHISLNPTFILSLLGAASLLASESAVEYVCSLIPVLGTVVAGGLSFVTVSKMLNKALNELAVDARNVLLAALGSEV